MTEFLEYTLFSYGDFRLTPANLIAIIVIYVVAKLLVSVISKKLLDFLFRRRKVDVGRSYAIRQFIKYFIYFIATILILQALGLKFTALLAGGAALLVGIGIGLQQTFNDLISGIILLMDASVEVGHIIQVNDMVGRVRHITLRTTHIQTRDEAIKIIPNSKLINNELINWSTSENATRFQVGVGVAYSSDVALVSDLILQAARVHPKVLKEPVPMVKFSNFGDSSLDFELQFYSHDYFRIEFVKSDLRYKILELFRKHEVEIPFPQTDVWMRK